MTRALDIAATGMKARQLTVDVISQNIANASTSAYKRQRTEFQDLLYQTQTRAGTSSSDTNTIIPTGIQLGLGVNTGAIYRIIEQGALQQTGNPFDLAIKGRGYFPIELPSGEIGYTRAGAFQINPDGQVVTAEGYLVQPGITVPADAVDITINAVGQVFAKLDGVIEPQNVGQFTLVNFINPPGLEAIGDNLFLQTEASGDPLEGPPGDPGFGEIQQGFVEQSNVDMITELTTLITAQRGFEQNSKVISTQDEMLQTLNNVR